MGTAEVFSQISSASMTILLLQFHSCVRKDIIFGVG